MPGRASEARVVALITAVQFVNVLDFMMIAPLGPDIGRDLGVPTAHLGWLGAAYTVSASLAGLAGTRGLDRLPRRGALVAAIVGLAVGTLAASRADGFVPLLAARVLAGAFGGPATSLSLSLVADTVPEVRRGRAMGTVMGGFSAASVLGVPAGLWMAQAGGWRAPFVIVGTIGLVIAALARAVLPAVAAPARRPVPLATLLARPTARRALASAFLLGSSAFLVIPNLSAYMQFNLGYPRERLGLLYGVGGTLSFFALRVLGRLIDRVGSHPVALGGAAGFVVLLALWLGPAAGALPVLPCFCAMMLTMSARNVSFNTFASKVPRPQERATYMSLQSSVQHLAAASGAGLGSVLLASAPDGALVGVGVVGVVSATLAALVPVVVGRDEARTD